MIIPAGTVEQQLRALLKEGRTPEEAVKAVLGPYRQALADAGNTSLADYSRPAVLHAARRLRSQLERRQRDHVFQAAPRTRERAQLQEQLTFRLPDGTIVEWARATREQHEVRAAWMQTFISSLEQDLRRHERVLKLLAEHEASCLADIEDWQDLIGDDLDDDPGILDAESS